MKWGVELRADPKHGHREIFKGVGPPPLWAHAWPQKARIWTSVGSAGTICRGGAEGVVPAAHVYHRSDGHVRGAPSLQTTQAQRMASQQPDAASPKGCTSQLLPTIWAECGRCRAKLGPTWVVVGHSWPELDEVFVEIDGDRTDSGRNRLDMGRGQPMLEIWLVETRIKLGPKKGARVGSWGSRRIWPGLAL